MNIFRRMRSATRFGSLLLLAAFLPMPLALADHSVLPPPELSDASENGQAPDIKESAPNLSDEFKSPDNQEDIEVRSYERKDSTTITEYSSHGRVYKIKVQPGGGLPAYYLYDKDGDGIFEQRLPGGHKRISPPMWILKKF